MMADRDRMHDAGEGVARALARPADGPLRTLFATAIMGLAFMAVGAQLVRLALSSQSSMSASMNETVAQSFARPDIVDRNGRLLATDVEAYSLFADPARVIDRNEVIEKLAGVFSDMDRGALRRDLADRNRRFVWIRRGLSPRVAQRIHNLGLPGLDFRAELRRAYPAGSLAGHVIGYVNIDNKGIAGIERYVDEVVGVEAVAGTTLSERPPVRLSLDIGVQHAVEAELANAIDRFKAKGAAGIVMDVSSGEVLSSVSIPMVDPGRPEMSLETARLDKVTSGTYELGSVFKAVTVAMALDHALVTPDTVFDVTKELKSGRYTIKDLHRARRPYTVAEIFEHSSNVGAALLGLQVGASGFQDFLRKLQLAEGMQTELGGLASPQLPKRWGEIETITASYGHGIALTPLQFAAAASSLVNGGYKVDPTFVKARADEAQAAVRVLGPSTSDTMRDLMRRNVVSGTGRRAEVAGYQVGGKTGTAEMAGPGGYRKKSVISSFLAAFPMDKPKYLVFVLLFEPQGTSASDGEILASLNAAPTTGRIISRIGPLLGMLPTQAAVGGRRASAFDASRVAQYENR
jgi:cell division protein FtsI (penicillin-binding protein 3)